MRLSHSGSLATSGTILFISLMSWERFFMKVGLFVTNQQQLATDMVAALDDQIAMVELARDRGWNSLFTGQHYLNEGDNKQLQAVPFLARLAAVSREMTIGLGILLLNLHNRSTRRRRSRPSMSLRAASSFSGLDWAIVKLSSMLSRWPRAKGYSASKITSA